MSSSTALTSEALDRLLGWLARDRDSAARRYEQIRSSLIRIFVCRGCTVPEDLADETIDRVAAKLPLIAGTYIGDPALYFYGVAGKIYLEHLKVRSAISSPEPAISSHETEQRYTCLEGCMDRLSQSNRQLIIAYYGNQGCNIDARKELAQRFGLRPGTLWLRAHRIRESLRKCVLGCLNQARDNSDNQGAPS